ncbi:MAG TPA: FtsQ-type POTRA domain-containing protein [Candidatus Rubrimentiphilum sp.]|nr:FtsQ-type POTRA domain-containing protein [Candidatus Rubrimentiphilum sp.]
MSKRKPVARRRRSAADRLKPFWILLVLFIAVIGLGGYYAATWPGFRARQIVVIGNHRVGAKAILHRAAIDRRLNIWLQDMRAVADRVAAIPDVGQVTIRRAFPASVSILVRERHPFASILSGGKKIVVDHDLRVLDFEAAPTLPQFVVAIKPLAPGKDVTDERVVRLRDDYDQLEGAHVIVKSMRYDRFGYLIAVTPRGVQLLLGGDDEDLARKISLIGPILSQVAGKKIAAIDLRAPGTPVVRYK